MQLGKIVLGAPLLASMLLMSCASVDLADKEADAAAKKFAVKPGLANIYVYRNESVGKAVSMEVLIDGVVAGKTGYKTFVLKQVHPGRHTIISRAENDVALSVTTVPGANYFVWQEVKMGVKKARSELQLMDESQGKHDVEKCKLVE